MTVLVTGSEGFLGRSCVERLSREGAVTGYDLPDCVLDRDRLREASEGTDQCLHLAAHKHAPLGEEEPAEVAEVNILGTRNVVEVFGRRVVLASTCKAADPTTAYGASKLIAERIVLNAGGRVVRLVNIQGSSGSVSDIWRQIPESEPLPVVIECYRMWMSPDEAVDLLTGALQWPTGRYAPTDRALIAMGVIARLAYPTRMLSIVPPRRGDRLDERLIAEYEWTVPWRAEAMRIRHPADPASTPEPGHQLAG